MDNTTIVVVVVLIFVALVGVQYRFGLLSKLFASIRRLLGVAPAAIAPLPFEVAAAPNDVFSPIRRKYADGDNRFILESAISMIKTRKFNDRLLEEYMRDDTIDTGAVSAAMFEVLHTMRFNHYDIRYKNAAYDALSTMVESSRNRVQLAECLREVTEKLRSQEDGLKKVHNAKNSISNSISETIHDILKKYKVE